MMVQNFFSFLLGSNISCAAVLIYLDCSVISLKVTSWSYVGTVCKIKVK